MSADIKYIPLTFVTAAAEKERLIRNTILFRHFSHESSEEVELSHYIESTQYGFNASAQDSGDYKFVRISDITDGEIAWDTVPFCDCDDPEGYLLKKHDIVVARTGGTTGKSFMVSTPPKNTIYAGYLIRVRANSKTNPLFLSVFLNSYLYWSQITSLNRDEFRPSVNAEKLKALRLPKFDRALQDRIVRLSNDPTDGADSSIRAELDSVLSKRNHHEAIVAEITHQETLLAKLQQAILQEAIQGKLTADWRAAHPQAEPARQLLHRIQAEKSRLIAAKQLRPEKPLPKITPEEIPFQIPKSWEWCRLAAVSNEIHYGFTASADQSRKETRLLRITDIQDDKVDWESVPGCRCSEREKKKYLLSEGDILIARTGGTVGKSYLVGSLPVQSVFASYLLRIVPSSIELAIFVKLYLGSPCYWTQLVDAARGAQPNVSGTKLKLLVIPLPPMAEQAAIVGRVETLLGSSRALALELAHTRTHAAHLLQAVLKEAFTPAA
jgi:type I restriction enzyme S subunit